MVQIIAGRKGKGKTKFLLEKVNSAVKEAHGTIVYGKTVTWRIWRIWKRKNGRQGTAKS